MNGNPVVAAKTEARNPEKYFPVVRILTGSRALIGGGELFSKNEEKLFESKLTVPLFVGALEGIRACKHHKSKHCIGIIELTLVQERAKL